MSDRDYTAPLDATVERLKHKYLHRRKTGSTVNMSQGSGNNSSIAESSPEKRTLTSAMKSPTSGLSYSERKHYNKAIRELFNIVKLNSDRLDKTNNSIHNSPPAVSDDEFSEEETDNGEVPDTNTQIYTETDVTLPSNLIRTSGSFLTDPCTEVVSVSSRRGGSRSQPRVSEEQGFLPAEISQIYEEMAVIHEKLQVESAAQQQFALQLHEREQKLLQREALLLKQHNALSKIRGVEEEVCTKVQMIKEQHDQEVKQLSETLKDKVKENKRLKSSFDTIKEVNDSMKKQLNAVSEQNKMLETQAKKVQARLDNLQRKYEFSMVQKSRVNIQPAVQEVKPQKQEKLQDFPKSSKVPTNISVYELLAVLMDWISDSHLCNLVPEGENDSKRVPGQHTLPNNCIQEKCTKLLPLLTEQLHLMPAVNSKLHVLLVKFIYWTLRQLEIGTQQTSLTSTMRRLGKEIYRGAIIQGELESSEEQANLAKQKSAIFFKSPNLRIRFLSTLIVLKTISQADYLAQAFYSLHKDLKSDEGKALFLEYQALSVVLNHLRTSSKGLLSAALDILLQMSVETRLLNPFLESCSNEAFFRTFSLLLRNPKLEVLLLEKISIILQKLTKIKRNKKLFELFSMHLMIQEMHRTVDPDHTFLSINLTSILFNLGMIKQNPQSSSLGASL
ncbi:coiled-coil domain-containing protein 138-like isoform X1 [Acipenser ruthenus]|uniref:coiled-coil domain-containing protein 138-like isoform X1 n=1 Tax=Acipenser ruthenus TaxID=7906 RepID=UPI002740F393|nr:coiled-coil domain-containing protein 138-like isoform X1 [Acipenser ruthenus]